MHSHLDIEVNGKSLVIPDDSSLSVEEKNPMFNDVTFFSYPMQIPVEGNREVLKNIAHRDSDMRAMDLEHADARIFAAGLPLNHGQVITQDGSEIKDTFEFNIDAQQQSFSELIGDLECRDVAVKDRLLIGKQVGKIGGWYDIYACNYVQCYGNSGMVAEGVAGDDSLTYYTGIGGDRQEIYSREDIDLAAPQALGFSIPMNINVSQPYPFPYCNVRVAYAVPGNSVEVVQTSSGGRGGSGGRNSSNSGNVAPVAQDNIGFRVGPYWVLNADRPQSGICFYVLYFLDCLFAQLGVTFDNSELLEIEDLKRLAFVTTKCSYDLEETGTRLVGRAAINQWLNNNQCGGVYSPRVKAGDRVIGFDANDNANIFEKYGENDHRIPRTTGYYSNVYYRVLNAHIQVSTNVCGMYANSGVFPDASVSSVISSIENSFGVRFLYDPEKRKVTAHLLRNIYRDNGHRRFHG